ncbi:hypothetical protein L227DRAFT_612590 [Lentinus tigrinus ALCF2SS1-6]|uniref:Uncharacterized protein n=1 Tax=Lentinus tigrinus ALCF2SS1-6 TaxID=1328759 RepID=A0A5C2S6E7_9APHY|nr:hypothetical protein L227DRAFT_612590 [Lentinus tigrinus ALCF2SS1-6]
MYSYTADQTADRTASYYESAIRLSGAAASLLPAAGQTNVRALPDARRGKTRTRREGGVLVWFRSRQVGAPDSKLDVSSSPGGRTPRLRASSALDDSRPIFVTEVMAQFLEHLGLCLFLPAAPAPESADSTSSPAPRSLPPSSMQNHTKTTEADRRSTHPQASQSPSPSPHPSCAPAPHFGSRPPAIPAFHVLIGARSAALHHRKAAHPPPSSVATRRSARRGAMDARTLALREISLPPDSRPCTPLLAALFLPLLPRGEGSGSWLFSLPSYASTDTRHHSPRCPLPWALSLAGGSTRAVRRKEHDGDGGDAGEVAGHLPLLHDVESVFLRPTHIPPVSATTVHFALNRAVPIAARSRHTRPT